MVEIDDIVWYLGQKITGPTIYLVLGALDTGKTTLVTKLSGQIVRELKTSLLKSKLPQLQLAGFVVYV